MKTLSASFEIVTPMFIGGSDQQTAQLRPSSLKGALRFWWRALNWSRVCALHGSDQNAALRQLHADESRLFGHAATDNGGGQGVFLMQVSDLSVKEQKQPFGTGFDNGILYLLGQGLGSFRDGNHCLRPGLAAGGSFDLRMLFRPGISQGDIASVVQAVQAFGLLGSLGSRARHGMGSVRMMRLSSTGLSLPDWTAPETLETYCQALTELLVPACTAPGLPPLSAFSRHARIDLSQCDKAAHDLLNAIGKEQQAYRSYQSSERNFAGDHDLMRDVALGTTTSQAPKRVVFGLPHNYYFSGIDDKKKKNVNVNARLPGEKEGRRASPLLLHVHRVGDRHVAVHTLLKANFLPQRASVEIKPSSGRGSTVPVATDWTVLTEFLDRFKKSTNPDWKSL